MTEKTTRIQILGVNGGYLDVEPGNAVPVVYAASEIRDVTEKKGVTSRIITLSDSINNHVLMQFHFDINVISGSISADKEIPCVLLEDGVSIMENAVMQLVSCPKSQDNSNKEQKINYRVIVKDQTSALYTRLGTKELTDIRLTDLNHTYSSANVVASFSNTAADGYKYPMPFNEDSTFNLTDFRPGVYGLVYLDRILSTNGFEYEWEEHNDDKTRFDKYIVPYNGEVPKKSQADIEFYKVIANESSDQEFESEGADGTVQNVPLDVLEIGTEVKDSSASYDPGTSVYTSPIYSLAGGSIAFKVVTEWELVLLNNSGASAYLKSVGGFGSPTMVKYQPALYLQRDLMETSWRDLIASAAGNDEGKISVPVDTVLPNGETVIGSGVKESNFAANLVASGHEYNLNAYVGMYEGNESYQTGSPAGGVLTSMYWRDADDISADPADVRVILRIKSVQLEIVPSMSELGFGQTVNMNDFIPKKFKQAEFIQGVLTKFNLMLEPDRFNENKLIIKSRDKYYDDGNSRDWTRKLSKQKDQEIVFIPSITSKKLILSYAQDEDEPNKTYKASTNEVYGQMEFTFNSEHVKGTETKEIPFAATPATVNSFGAVVSMINGASPRTKPRLLYDGGLFDCQEFLIVDYYDGTTPVGTTSTQYPLTTHFDKPFYPTHDINFGTNDYYYYEIGSKTNNTGFNLHWRRTINQINTGDMLTAYFDLSAEDMQETRLSDKIYVGNTWFNINKIEYNAASSAETKCELIVADTELNLADFKVVPPPYQPPKGDPINPGKGVIKKGRDKENVIGTTFSGEVQGKNNSVQEGIKSGMIMGDRNQVSAEAAIIIGSSKIVERPGVYTPLVMLEDGTEITDKKSLVNAASEELVFIAKVYSAGPGVAPDLVIYKNTMITNPVLVYQGTGDYALNLGLGVVDVDLLRFDGTYKVVSIPTNLDSYYLMYPFVASGNTQIALETGAFSTGILEDEIFSGQTIEIYYKNA